MAAPPPVALVLGAGPGLGGSLCRLLASKGYRVAAGSRGGAPAVASVAGVSSFKVDGGDAASVEAFVAAAENMGHISLAVFNVCACALVVASCGVVWRAGSRPCGAEPLPRPAQPPSPGAPSSSSPRPSLSAAGGCRASAVRWQVPKVVACKTLHPPGFHLGQAAAKRMAPRGSGTIIFTGATASLRGSALFSCFASPKFGLRALAQSMARELGPKGVHVAHVIVDGGIRPASAPAGGADTQLDPDSIATSYLALHEQHRSAWTHGAAAEGAAGAGWCPLNDSFSGVACSCAPRRAGRAPVLREVLTRSRAGRGARAGTGLACTAVVPDRARISPVGLCLSGNPKEPYRKFVAGRCSSCGGVRVCHRQAVAPGLAYETDCLRDAGTAIHRPRDHDHF